MASPTHTRVQARLHIRDTILWRDNVVACTALLFISGLYLDGWAHVHVPTLETFFTPWHGVLYSGFALLALAIGLPILLRRPYTATWRAAVPAGYGLGVIGVLIFALGGLGDMTWHSLFGIESDTEALLSPPHLLLATGAGLMVGTPLRVAWERDDTPTSWGRWLPALLSISMLLALIAFFTSYVHPFATTAVSDPSFNHQAAHATIDLPLAAMLIQSSISNGSLLFLIRRWGGRWPFGSITLLMTLSLVPVSVMFDRFLARGPLPLILAAVFAGLASDVLLRLLQPTYTHPRRVRVFAAAVPVTLIASYLAAIGLTSGIAWSVHLVGGAVVIVGIAGWLLSYLVIPPVIPTDG